MDMGLFGIDLITLLQKGALYMYRDIFPPKNNKIEPEERIDCGVPTMLERLTGKQQIVFAIKGKATFEFDLVFRLYQHQIEEYVKILEPDYPNVKFSVNANTLHVTVQVDYLCDTYPLTTAFTSSSCVHSQTWIETRNATRMVDDIYSRILELHMEKVTHDGGKHGTKSITAAAMEISDR
jgi:hypothetical protein